MRFVKLKTVIYIKYIIGAFITVKFANSLICNITIYKCKIYNLRNNNCKFYNCTIVKCKFLNLEISTYADLTTLNFCILIDYRAGHRKGVAIYYAT